MGIFRTTVDDIVLVLSATVLVIDVAEASLCEPEHEYEDLGLAVA